MPDLVNRVVRSKRRTIALVVERDGTVTVRAPMKMAVKAIHDFVQKHEQWIRKKQEEIRSMPVEQPRQYRTGELFLFLGRPYPLEIVNTTLSRLRLEHDIFQMPQARQHNAAVLFQDWYRQQARRIITERVYFFCTQAWDSGPEPPHHLGTHTLGFVQFQWNVELLVAAANDTHGDHRLCGHP